jgi:alpha-D-ribose 1-methylphosphonate 5-triphosphate synthase subunit PhnH
MHGCQERVTGTIAPGLKNPPQDNQRIFRAILLTMSRPGTVTALGNWPQPPASLHPAATAVCLALADMDTPLWLGPSAPADARTYLRFHCGSPLVDREDDAVFAIITDGHALPDLALFCAGTPEYPDRSATVIIQVRSIEVGCGVRLSGPGIPDEVRLAVDGLHTDFWQAMQWNSRRYPLGFDTILATKTEIVSLPRTVRVGV